MNGTQSFYEYRFSGGEVVVGKLIPYLMQKNLFELFALTGGGDAKTEDATVRARATWWSFHCLIFCGYVLILNHECIIL